MQLVQNPRRKSTELLGSVEPELGDITLLEGLPNMEGANIFETKVSWEGWSDWGSSKRRGSAFGKPVLQNR
jgi:hypothetical protein